MLGVLAVSGACLGWAIDNNLTQRLSVRDPLAIAQVKGLLGGGVALALAVLFGRSAPPAGVVGLGVLVGFVSYGLSVALAVYAMREIGVAREAALFATAPFLGVGVSVVLLHEPFGLRELAATALMLTGLALLATERHSHHHVHEPMRHDHRHVHDAHHAMRHAPSDPAGEPHAGGLELAARRAADAVDEVSVVALRGASVRCVKTAADRTDSRSRARRRSRREPSTESVVAERDDGLEGVWGAGDGGALVLELLRCCGWRARRRPPPSRDRRCSGAGP